MSKPPGPPSRVLVKIRVVIPVVSSSKIVGPASSAVEFTTQPRVSAGPQPRASRLSWRREPHKAPPPPPPPAVALEDQLVATCGKARGKNVPARLAVRAAVTG